MDASTSRPALVYCRVSTTGQEEHGTSLDSQASACIAHADALGFTVGRVTREVYSGAELWDRPKLSADRTDLKAGQFGALICYATDRLSRDPIHLAILAEECERAGVALHFVSETFDDSDESALIRYIKGYSNKKEREKIRERTLRGKYTRAVSGRVHNAGAELYGYRRDRERGVRVICESEAAVIRQIYTWIAAERLPVRAVVRRLNDQGIPPPSAGKFHYPDPDRVPRWGRNQVCRILEHPAYRGEAVAWRWQRFMYAGHRAVAQLRPESEWVRLPDGVTPAIVSPELWAEARAVLASNRGETTRNTARPRLLRGHIWCDVCGKRLTPMIENGTSGHPRAIYRCSSRDTASGACGGKRVPAQLVEAWAWEWIAAVLRDPDLIADELRRRQTAGPDAQLSGDLDKAKREVARCERDQARLMRRFASAGRDGSDDDDDDDDAGDDALWKLTEREIKRLEAEKGRWQATASEAQRRLQEQAVADVQLASLHQACAIWAANLESVTFEEQRDAVVALDVQVSANGTDTAHWHIRGAVPIGPAEPAASGELPTTCSCLALRVPERRCWRGRCRQFCPGSR